MLNNLALVKQLVILLAIKSPIILQSIHLIIIQKLIQKRQKKQ